MLTQQRKAKANPVASERVHAMHSRWLAEPGGASRPCWAPTVQFSLIVRVQTG
ncbi:hypothetical protein FACS1894129_1230 [Actinomycetota bacterium]|nr:hypothetical protein FACS1894129_1230 [Actinomycetota bacterium]